MIEIKHLQSLLATELPQKKIQSVKCENLTAPGENYGSVMLSLALTLKDEGKQYEELLQLVAKTCAQSDFVKQIFNIQLSYKKEVQFYKTIIPSVQNFQKGRKFFWDFFPKYYGGRYNCNGSEMVDDDFCILLENIKIQNFQTGHRMLGFNLQTAKFILEHLAAFHAVPIAMKLTQAQLFNETVKKHIEKGHFDEKIMPEAIRLNFLEEIVQNIKSCAKFDQHIDVITKILMESGRFLYNGHLEAEEPFATVVHNDFWTNNMMIQYDDEGNPLKMQFLDFQLAVYGNPINDVLFFIYTSCENQVIRNHFKELIDHYYSTFLKVLKEYQIENADQTFSKQLFHREIKRSIVQSQLWHILNLFNPIFTRSDKAIELKDLKEDSMKGRDQLDEEKYFAKMTIFLNDCIANQWI